MTLVVHPLMAAVSQGLAQYAMQKTHVCIIFGYYQAIMLVLGLSCVKLV